MKPIDRKQELLAQAAIHRQRVAEARHSLAAGLHPGMLVKGAGGLALAALTLLRKRNGDDSSGGMAALLPLALPLALRGISLLGKVKAPKPTMRKFLIAGALGAVAAFAVKKASARRRARADAAHPDRKTRRM